VYNRGGFFFMVPRYHCWVCEKEYAIGAGMASHWRRWNHRDPIQLKWLIKVGRLYTSKAVELLKDNPAFSTDADKSYIPARQGKTVQFFRYNHGR